jgi:spore germination protein KB
LDAIVVLTFLITIFFKVSILLYGVVIGIVDLFKLKNHPQILLPVGVILIFWSMAISSNFSEHIEEGAISGRYSHILFYMIVPVLMLLIAMIRNGFKKKTKDEKSKSESNST